MLYLACGTCRAPVRDDPCTGVAQEHSIGESSGTPCAGSNRKTVLLDWPPYEQFLLALGAAPDGVRTEVLKMISVAHKLTEAERRYASSQLVRLLAL